MQIYLMYIAYIVMFYSTHGNAETISTNGTLSTQESTSVVSSLNTQIATQYVDANTAAKASLILTRHSIDKKYLDTKDPIVFTKTINKDLLSATHDKHLQLIFAPQGIEQWLNERHQTIEPLQLIDTRNVNNNENNGFGEIKILKGNIGYINLTAFYSPEIAAGTLTNAMNFLSNTSAIIIDLRNNTGGSPEMVQLISSYFFDEKPVHLNTFYIRHSNEYIQTWTRPILQSKHRPDIDIYLLTSHNTFSAAEEFSYNLQNLKRATLIGETTAGGAHAGDFQQLTARFFVYMPFAKAINPITNSNWEGIGVQPHIKVSKEQAFDVAYEKALQKNRDKKH